MTERELAEMEQRIPSREWTGVDMEALVAEVRRLRAVADRLRQLVDRLAAELGRED